MLGRAYARPGRVSLLLSVSTLAVSAGTCAADAQQASTTPLETINVTTNVQQPLDGSAAAGYRVGTSTTSGPVWDDLDVQDTPYSISIDSSDLIENTISSATDQIFEMNPYTQINMNQSRGYGSVIYIRGFRLADGFTEQDGTRLSGDLIMPLEDKERVEVLAGLSGFLYGPGNVGGLVNYVLKRPTPTPYGQFTVGDYGGGQGFAHIDVGGPIDKDGRFGYRLNLVRSDGYTSIAYNHIDKWLASLALDWHVTDNLLLQVNYSHQHYYETGTQADWGSFGGSFAHFDPSILNPAKNYSQPWSYNSNEMDVAGTNVDYKFSPNLDFRGAYRFTSIVDSNVYTGNNVSYDNGQYTYQLTAVHNAPMNHINNSGYGLFDYTFDIFSIRNKITTGYYGDSYALREHQDSFQSVSLGSGYAVSSNPIYVAEPNFTNGVLPDYTVQRTVNSNVVLGDEIKFNDQWSALAGLNYAIIDTTNFNTNGSTSSQYDKGALTPSASLMYKPFPWITTYATYMQSLDNSGTASTTYDTLPVTNGGQALSPTISHQYEIGVKASVAGVLLTGALFDIDKANTYYASTSNGSAYVFTSDGRQTDKGIELTATGKVTQDLSVIGGVTLMDARITNTNTAYLEGQPAYGAARQIAKLYGEYNVPFLRGFTLTGGVQYVGGQLANEYAYPNPDAREWLPAYVIGDVGARYTTRIEGIETIFRLNITNVANTSYWQQAEVIGPPRTISFSASARF